MTERNKYWIVPGMEVVHRDDVSEMNVDRMHLFKMTVEKVVRRKAEDGRTRVDGVRCHWIDNERKFQVGMFHTHELIPFDVASSGIEEVNKWITNT